MEKNVYCIRVRAVPDGHFLCTPVCLRARLLLPGGERQREHAGLRKGVPCGDAGLDRAVHGLHVTHPLYEYHIGRIRYELRQKEGRHQRAQAAQKLRRNVQVLPDGRVYHHDCAGPVRASASVRTHVLHREIQALQQACDRGCDRERARHDRRRGLRQIL